MYGTHAFRACVLSAWEGGRAIGRSQRYRGMSTWEVTRHESELFLVSHIIVVKILNLKGRKIISLPKNISVS